VAIRGNCSAFGESSLTLSANGSDQVCLGLGIKTFDTQQHHRRAPVASNGKVRVKIMVQRDTNAFVVPRSFQNEAVLCLFHSDFCHMNRLEALFTKDRCCAGSEPLVLSCNAIDAESLIVDGSGCEAQCLLNVFRLEKGVFGEKGITARISREQFQDAPNRDPHTANTRFSGTLTGLHRNAIKWICCRHVISLGSIARFNPTAFQAVGFQQPVPRLRQWKDGGIQAKRARGLRPESIP